MMRMSTSTAEPRTCPIFILSGKIGWPACLSTMVDCQGHFF